MKEETTEQDQTVIAERSKHDIAEFFNNNENDIDEVLLIDQNLEIAQNAITVIAPGQVSVLFLGLFTPISMSYVFQERLSHRVSIRTMNHTLAERNLNCEERIGALANQPEYCLWLNKKSNVFPAHTLV